MAGKLRFILLLILACLLIAPIAFAKSDQPLYISKAEVYTRNANQGITAELKVCSRTNQRTKFEVLVENETINARYNRKLLSLGNGCYTYEIKFNEEFSMTSNAGDKMKFTLRNIENVDEEYKKSKSYYTTIEERDEVEMGCSDKNGGDGEYEVCLGDFITHKTGVRMRVITIEKRYITMRITGVEWGGAEKLLFYEGREKEIIAGNGDRTRLNVTYTGRGEEGGVMVMIESN